MVRGFCFFLALVGGWGGEAKVGAKLRIGGGGGGRVLGRLVWSGASGFYFWVSGLYFGGFLLFDGKGGRCCMVWGSLGGVSFGEGCLMFFLCNMWGCWGVGEGVMGYCSARDVLYRFIGRFLGGWGLLFGGCVGGGLLLF